MIGGRYPVMLQSFGWAGRRQTLFASMMGVPDFNFPRSILGVSSFFIAEIVVPSCCLGAHSTIQKKQVDRWLDSSETPFM